MNKIFLIIQREYSVRVKKKSFIIMTLLGPLLFGSLMVGPALVAKYVKDDTIKKIAVIDETGKFVNLLPEKATIKFKYLSNTTLEQARKTFSSDSLYGVLYIPTVVEQPDGVRFFSEDQPNLELKNHMESSIGKEIERSKLATYNIADIDTILKTVKTEVSMRTIQWNEDGSEKESSTEMNMGIAYISGFAIYMFIFLFGAQVMRGVIEEKTSRIVEVIISSVKPFQLMMGKILGIAAVGLTQLLIWVMLTTAIVTIAKAVLVVDSSSQVQIQNTIDQASANPMAGNSAAMAPSSSKVEAIFTMLGNANLPYIIGCFFFFFIGGYLLYSSMFAAVGAAVDNETESQQFMLPVTIPLILSIFIMMSTFQDPDSSLSFWFSMIPFTSPIIMMARVPFGVPDWQLALSAAILIASFIGMTWLSSKIYRVGILMYGKKTSWKEMWKWMWYSN
ncbi:ABC transporter permease [Williamwhitmania taraxaci]|uniref:ABC-2 type transport system permease protein n=1 Tax=Williamwhitmania taraxaci TaxID=1640674 RepID=A0A1G6HBZ1_9BACT|nr:ABC transporter permease [Williamwhitmania taraxaci]SDB91608.1 ABC-2 type transport system permease protein [Williamwhitmania taraxaci]